MSLLNVQDLKTYYKTHLGWLRAVDGVSFSVENGESLGIVGESGCGKTTAALSILGILPHTAKITGGKILFEGIDLTTLPPEARRTIRWKKISMIFQAAMNALNPVYKVGSQLMDVYMTRDGAKKNQAKKRVAELFELVGLEEERMNSYPHVLSGGMKQRVMIAMSLLCNPTLIIADEPTTALDVVVQDRILSEIKDLQRKLNFSMILITHNILMVAHTCDRMVVMYAGKIFESGDVISVVKKPRNPYTIALMSCLPALRGPLRKLDSISGAPPNLVNHMDGCIFSPRCLMSQEICRQKAPPLLEVGQGHYSRCHFTADACVHSVAG